MSTFINIQHPQEHPGVKRAEAAVEGALRLRQRWSAFSGLVALLLTAVVAAVLVVAYQVMDSVVEGHLLVMWMALWAVAFAGMALYSGTVRSVVARGKSVLDSWAHGQAKARADERLWVIATAASWPTCTRPSPANSHWPKPMLCCRKRLAQQAACPPAPFA